ncbi:hypothetical protein Sjap_012776 [Stephania japonica]|uniref:Uncharacterized protein n=1 Tax=Stephania japonica TaxID=461633 RepID=A0AAP0NYK6_9MAGN
MQSGNAIDRKRIKIIPIIERFYGEFFPSNKLEMNRGEFYHAVCQIVQEINASAGGVQLRVPSYESIKKELPTTDPSSPTIDQRKIENVIVKVFPSAGVIGKATISKIMLSIFGVPAAALFIKGKFYPKVGIKDEYLIPAVTSATVLALSMMRMI